MRIVISYWMFFLFIAIQPLRAEIREIQKIKDILPTINNTTLVVFDIDNTLLEPVGNLGSDQWFYYLYDVYKLNGVSEKDLSKKTMEVWNRSQSMIKIKAVENTTSDLIRELHRKGVKTMGLTARTSDIKEVTLRQLRSVRIHLDQNTVRKSELRINRERLSSDEDAFYKNGVLFVGEKNNKGVALSYFLKYMRYYPKKIVFVDDKDKHVKNMEMSMSTLGIPFVGFRYGALDQKVKLFKEVMSEVKEKAYSRLFLLGEVEN